MSDAAAGGLQARRAISADAHLLRRLDSRPRGRVHSVFARTVNIEVEGGDLVTLACRSVDNAPDTVVIDVEGFGDSGIGRGDRVDVAPGTLGVGSLRVCLDGVSSWSVALPSYPRDDARLRANLHWVRDRLRRTDHRSHLPGQGRSADPFADASRAALEARSAALCAALLHADLDAARAGAATMVGLGPGLTPSGDDFLVGLFAILNVAKSPCHPMRALCGDVVAIARTSTNAISVAALANAARGRVRESIHALARELIDGAPGGLRPALDRVLAIGATSGSDIVAGLVSGLSLNLRMRANAVRSRARCLRPAGPRPLRGRRSTYP